MSDAIALLIIQTAKKYKFTRSQTIPCLSTGIQESNLDQNATDSTGHRGVYQQDGGYPNRETAIGNVEGFFERLVKKMLSPGASFDIWLNIFWLQQRPSEPSATQAYNNGRKAYLAEIKSHIDEATKLYDRLSGDIMNVPQFEEINLIDVNPISDNSQDREGTPIDLLICHTTEGAGGMDLVNYCANNEVSYHYLIDNDEDGNTVYDLVDTDLASWSVLSANNRSINYVIGRSTANWTRADWLSKARNAIRIMAYLMVADAQKYDIKPYVIGHNYNLDPPGITDHGYVTKHLQDGTHTDVGENFPWDILTADVAEFSGGTPAPTPTTELTTDEKINAIYDKICAYPRTPAIAGQWPSRSMFADDGKGVDDTVGMLLNIDGNVWNIEVLIGCLCGLQDDIERVKRAANGNFPPDSYVAGNSWLRKRAQVFAAQFLVFCEQVHESFQAPVEASPVMRKAKKQ